MKKLDGIILKIFLYGLPIALPIFIFLYVFDTTTTPEGYIKVLYDLGGCVFGFWLIISLYLSIRLLVSGLFRENVLAKLASFKERDEREVILTGKAAKTTVLTTLAILIFLFFLSCLQITLTNLPPEKAVEEKNKILAIRLGFSVRGNLQQPKSVEDGEEIFFYNGLPVSSSTVILGLIVWQITSYNYTMRRLM